MIPVHNEKGVTVYWSHSLFVLLGLPSNSVDSIVTDPPYGLSFMGKKWDYDVPSVQLWREALRVLKPGGHLLSFGGSRTYHRLTVNIEDAGFEIRDQIMWLYGSGFPKSLDVSKAIDKAAGAEREQIMCPTKKGNLPEQAGDISLGANGMTDLSTPATLEAQQWDGWGTALKPAHEPICVARKPLIGTVAENVLEHGTGAINIDGGRIGTDERFNPSASENKIYGQFKGDELNGRTTKGRFPANIIFDSEAGTMLDKQSGESISVKANVCNKGSIWGSENNDIFERGHNDSGGASRFFYCAKASKQDRDDGLELFKLQVAGGMEGRRDGSMGKCYYVPQHTPHSQTHRPHAIPCPACNASGPQST